MPRITRDITKGAVMAPNIVIAWRVHTRQRAAASLAAAHIRLERLFCGHIPPIADRGPDGAPG